MGLFSAESVFQKIVRGEKSVCSLEPRRYSQVAPSCRILRFISIMRSEVTHDPANERNGDFSTVSVYVASVVLPESANSEGFNRSDSAARSATASPNAPMCLIAT